GFNLLARLGDQQHLERGFFLTAAFFVHSGSRKHLKRPAEIEDLYFIKDYDPDSFAIHSNYWENLTSAVSGGGTLPLKCKQDAQSRAAHSRPIRPIFHSMGGGALVATPPARALSYRCMRYRP